MLPSNTSKRAGRGSKLSFEKQLWEEIKKIEKELNMPYMISWERAAERRGKRKGKLKGIEIGKAQGIEIKAKETAKNLLEMGLDIDKIVKATGLKKEVVKKLKGRDN